jgi:glycosyltransferase involved in cell wall biosynthesis
MLDGWRSGMNQAQQGPLVSVIIPCLNRETLVGDAIESALNQTHPNLEIIIVDDGSTDGTGKVVQRYTGSGKVRYLRHEVNKGIPTARNTGIRNSLGDYVAFLDSDDLWLPNKIEVQLRAFSQDTTGQVGMIWTDAYYVHASAAANSRTSGVILPPDFDRFTNNELLKLLVLRNVVIGGTSMVRRSCFDKVGLLDEDLRGGGDDYDLWLRLAPHFKFRYVPTPLAVVRLHSGNHTSVEGNTRDTLRSVRKAVARDPQLAALQKIKIAQERFVQGKYCFEHGRILEAREHLFQTIGYHPVSIQALAAWIFIYCPPLGRVGLRAWRQIRGLAR